MTEIPAEAAGATHRHYKGGYYRVLHESVLHTETGEHLVIYEHLYPHGRNVYARPHRMFYELLPDGRPRFEKIED